MKLTSHISLLVLALASTSSLFSGCANMSTLQTARVEPPGKSNVTIAAGYVNFASYTTAAGGASIGLPYAEGMYRRGIVQNLDFGVRLTLIGTVAGDVKYQLVDAGGFALSLGAGLGFLYLDSAGTGVLLLDTQVPVYMSYDFNEYFALYLTPKFLLRAVVVTSGSATASGLSPMFGGSFGLKAGKDIGGLGEVSYGHSTNGYAGQLQVTAGVFFKI